MNAVTADKDDHVLLRDEKINSEGGARKLIKDLNQENLNLMSRMQEL